jgi:hypothetical protein
MTNKEPENSANWNLISGNSSNMIFMANINANPKSYEIGIFDENNECRSIGKYENKFWYFTKTVCSCRIVYKARNIHSHKPRISGKAS